MIDVYSGHHLLLTQRDSVAALTFAGRNNHSLHATNGLTPRRGSAAGSSAGQHRTSTADEGGSAGERAANQGRFEEEIQCEFRDKIH